MATAAAVFTEAADWHFPRSMVLPLAYWVLVCSVLGYYSVTWAMRHLPASQVRLCVGGGGGGGLYVALVWGARGPVGRVGGVVYTWRWCGGQ